MRIIALGAVSWAACSPEGSGIAIGNPPSSDEAALARVTVADGDDVAMVDFNVAIDAMFLEDCDGFGQRIDLETGTVLGLENSTLLIPPGEWCGITLQPTERPAVLQGTVSDKGRFQFRNALGRISLFNDDGALFEQQDTYVLELAEPGWVTVADFDVRGGAEQVVGGDGCLDDRLCERIRSGLMDRAGLFKDPDENGMVDDNERDGGADASGDERRERRPGR